MKDLIMPPRLPLKLLRFLIRRDFLEEIEGDMEEVFYDNLELYSERKAKWLYVREVLLLLLRSNLVRFPTFTDLLNTNIMVKHYLQLSLRQLGRNKADSFLNLFSLAVGIGICLVICQYVFFEMSHDRMHSEYERTYRVILDRFQDGTLQGPDLYMAHSLGVVAEEEVPDIAEHVTLYVPDEGAYVTNLEQNLPITVDGKEMLFASKRFLHVFDFPLKMGNKETAFDNMFNVVITEKVAAQLFGETDPIGKNLKIGGGASAGDYLVTGVLEDLPSNSHLQFDYLFPIENFFEYGWLGVVKREPHVPIFANYLVVHESASPQSVQQQLNRAVARYSREWNPYENMSEKVRLQPIADIHLKSETYTNADFVANKGNLQDVRSFIIIALFILCIAWVNYINLSTARSIYRAREVGIRKSIGAFRQQLIGQFLTESLVINLLGAFLGVGLAVLIIPGLNHIIGRDIGFQLFYLPMFWGCFVLAILFGAVLSGLYPAFIISAFKPVSVLKANFGGKQKGLTLRRGLIMFQFLASLCLMSGTYLVYKQITFMKSQELGMDIKKIVAIRGPKHIEVLDGGPQLTSYEGLQAFNQYSRKTFRTFREEVNRLPAISSMTGSWSIPGQAYGASVKDVRKWGAPESENRPGKMFSVGLDFMKTYGLELLAGKPFSQELSEESFVLLNEKALGTFGFTDPEGALQEKILVNDRPHTILGVVSNFHWKSLKEAHTPWLLRFVGGTPPYISIKLDAANAEESLARVKATYDALYPGNPFDYFFVDDQFDQQYHSDVQFGKLFLSFTLIAIFIACMGLFALVTFSASRRIKEIGVRKVLGASTGNLILLLSREYLWLLLGAIVLSIPAVVYWGRTWLDNYAFRTELGIDFLLVPGLVITLIAMLTVGRRTYFAAISNPVDSLRKE
ncbi:MAG: FtsX-like permease family protein [Bacteroidota bacterium]